MNLRYVPVLVPIHLQHLAFHNTRKENHGNGILDNLKSTK